MRLIITRHGETYDNKNRIATGQLPGELTDEGLAQARKLGERLKEEKIDIIFSSDLKRTVDTAKEILRFHPDAKIVLDKRLRERNLGIIQGKPYPPDWDWNNLPEDAETDQEICLRAKGFLDDLFEKYGDLKNIVIACHGGMKMAILCILNEDDADDFGKYEGIMNTSVSEFEIGKDKKIVQRRLNCIEHLSE